MKEVIVIVDNTDACQQRVEIAASYASKMGAHLTGLFVTPDIMFPRYVSEGIVAEARKQHDKEFGLRVENARQVFDKVAERVESGADLLAVQGDFSEVVTGHSRCADLLVMGQAMTGQGEVANQEAPDKIILRSGRPVLVVPYIKCNVQVPKRVMVAWDGSREATRALHDALPLLEQADQVEVVNVTEAKSKAAHYADMELLLIQLERHGVTATSCQIEKTKLSTGNLLLNHIVDSGASLLVTGAYGHTRLREIVMGGVSQEVLEHCSIPVLMSR